MCKLNSSILAIFVASLAIALMASADTASQSESTGETSPKSVNTELTADVTKGVLLGGSIGKPIPKPEPDPTDVQWTRISPSDVHSLEMAVSGWTIFSLQAQQDTVLNVYIYDADWNLLAEFDSTGCGAFLQIKPQVVNVVIFNSSLEFANQYILHVFDVASWL